MSTATPAPATPRWRCWLVEAAIFIAVLTAFQLWQLRDAARGPAPDISGHDLGGNPFHLLEWQDSHPNQAGLVYFWAEWCPVCKTTAGSVSSIDADWPVISVAVQSGDDAAVARHMQASNYKWATVNDVSGEWLRRFGLPGTPAFAIIAPDGNIRFVAVGYTSEIGLRLRLWWATRQTT